MSTETSPTEGQEAPAQETLTAEHIDWLEGELESASGIAGMSDEDTAEGRLAHAKYILIRDVTALAKAALDVPTPQVVSEEEYSLLLAIAEEARAMRQGGVSLGMFKMVDALELWIARESLAILIKERGDEEVDLETGKQILALVQQIGALEERDAEGNTVTPRFPRPARA